MEIWIAQTSKRGKKDNPFWKGVAKRKDNGVIVERYYCDHYHPERSEALACAKAAVGK